MKPELIIAAILLAALLPLTYYNASLAHDINTNPCKLCMEKGGHVPYCQPIDYAIGVTVPNISFNETNESGSQRSGE